jgi:hypothetical protein
MKKSCYIILIFLILLSISTAYGFEANTTDSDKNIVLVQHLIEIDSMVFQADNKLAIKETLIFKNVGAKNFSGTLRTWVPDNVENISIARGEMSQNALIEPVQFTKEGNIVSWSADIEINSLPPLFSVDYVQAAQTRGTVSKVLAYSKKFIFLPLINYTYMDRPDLPAIVIKVNKSADSSIIFLDENGNKLTTSDVSGDEKSIISRFSNPQFKELTIQISKTPLSGSSSSSGIIVYVILGILILIVISYPILRKKKERGTEEQHPQETEDATGEEQVKEVSEHDEDISGKTKNELEEMRNDLISKSNKLDKDYSGGDLMDEEYEELKNSYKTKIRKINVRLKQS